MGRGDANFLAMKRGWLEFLIVTGATLFASCRDKNECGTDCPRASARVRLVQGTATIVALDGTESILKVISGPASRTEVGTCTLLGLDAEVFSDNEVGGPINLDCHTSNFERGTFTFAGVVRDPRSLAAGITQTSDFWWIGCPDPVPSNLTGLTMTVSVEQALGDIAPYPAMVTADYARRYTVALDTGATDCSLSSAPAGCPICQQIERMTLSMALEQTAADYSYTERGACLCD